MAGLNTCLLPGLCDPARQGAFHPATPAPQWVAVDHCWRDTRYANMAFTWKGPFLYFEVCAKKVETHSSESQDLMLQ
ncbi:hypothetical protein CDAR_7841 [Caerostris darwini]|uniref:Uncharacterized protein n=1 Tax=Caerostris darwini TaxID=1538125 RepID=A0AAV4Q9Y7_9ARAC|nr:hypothetical protein CDAR_7841 [Caerostris darwini]